MFGYSNNTQMRERPPVRYPKLLSPSAHCFASALVVPVYAMTATFIL
jgi:hypothetical protein